MQVSTCEDLVSDFSCFHIYSKFHPASGRIYSEKSLGFSQVHLFAFLRFCHFSRTFFRRSDFWWFLGVQPLAAESISLCVTPKNCPVSTIWAGYTLWSCCCGFQGHKGIFCQMTEWSQKTIRPTSWCHNSRDLCWRFFVSVESKTPSLFELISCVERLLQRNTVP